MRTQSDLEKAKERVIHESPVHGPVILAEIERLEIEVTELRKIKARVQAQHDAIKAFETKIVRLETRIKNRCTVHRDAECNACWEPIL